MGPSGFGALVASLGSRVPSLFRHGHEQLVQAVAERRIGLGEQVAVAVEHEAGRGVPGPDGDLLGEAPAAIHSATAVWRRSWMRSPGRPAARVAGRQMRLRNAVTRSGPPAGERNTGSVVSHRFEIEL
jgi:hypothetical protein